MIAYTYKEGLYLNITNRCSNRCTFCIRQYQDGVGGHNLILKEEPTIAEILAAVEKYPDYDEITFCGYGEPTCRLDVLLNVGRELKKRGCHLRLNTNGQGSLINGYNIVPELGEVIDYISISLNAQDAETYHEICHSDYGREAYSGLLNFVEESVKHISHVRLTVVAVPGVDIEACRLIAEKLQTDFMVR